MVFAFQSHERVMIQKLFEKHKCSTRIQTLGCQFFFGQSPYQNTIIHVNFHFTFITEDYSFPVISYNFVPIQFIRRFLTFSARILMAFFTTHLRYLSLYNFLCTVRLETGLVLISLKNEKKIPEVGAFYTFSSQIQAFVNHAQWAKMAGRFCADFSTIPRPF